MEYICGNLADELPLLAGKKLLISGGAGFLGFYLVQAVLHWNRTRAAGQPIQLSVYDNNIRGAALWLEELGASRDLILGNYDIAAPLPPNMGDYQYIIHSASIASPKYYRTNPIGCMDANVNGLRSLLAYCHRQGETGEPVEGFLFFSSSEIYGDTPPEHIPTPETYWGNVSCTGPRACYDEAKRYGETLCVNFVRQYGLPIKIVRPFNNYGPGLKITDGRVLADFVRNVLAGTNIVMFSDGKPTRTFCYVADATVGYYKALLRGRSGQAYNIGVEEPEISVAELASRIVALSNRLFNYTGRVEHKVSNEKDYLVDNPSRRCPAIAKARTELDYNPSVPLNEGLRRSLLWYADNYGGQEA